MKPEDSGKPRVLMSWKEIAAYLSIDERTCARWEKRFSMPVHRPADATVKSRVFAYPTELDRWLERTFPRSHEEEPPLIEREKRRSIRKQLLWISGFIGITLIAIILLRSATLGRLKVKQVDTQAADFHIFGSNLIVVNEKDKEVWRQELPFDGLYPESEYRKYFQISQRDTESGNLPWMIIKDINGDGENETLMAVRLKSNGYGEGLLLCFDSHGTELWKFPAGKETKFKGNDYSADYRIHGFVLRDSDADGFQEIYVISYHFPWELCQLAFLDHRGKILGDYWNAGYLTDLAFADLDQDGREELYVVGVNNEYGGGCLAVFDPTDIHGGSPQSEEYEFDDLGAGSEIYYVRFPRTEASLATGEPVGPNLSIGVTSSRTLNIMAHLGLFYELDETLSCVSVIPGHSFELSVKELLAENRLHRSFDKGYYEMLRKSLRYWSGRSWSNTPTKNLMHAIRAETSASGVD